MPNMTRRFSDQTQFLAIRDQVCCELTNELVILSLRDSTYYGLNPIGAEIWTMIQQPRALGDIREYLLANYTVSPEVCEEELQGFLQEMADHGLVEVRDADSG